MRGTIAAVAFLVLFSGNANAEPFGIMFESDQNEIGGSELAFNTYASLADILTASATSSTFSDIDVNGPYTSSGLYFVPPQGSVPEPATLTLFAPLLAALALMLRRTLLA